MKFTIRAAIWLCAAALGAAAFAEPSETPKRIKLGDPAPGIGFEQVQQGPYKLQGDWKGKVHVVEFWATWCGPCRYSAPHLSELQEKYGGDGLIVLGISDETRETVEAFMKELDGQMEYNVAIDPSRQSHDQWMGSFGINGIPHAFLVDKRGRVVWHGHPMDESMEMWIKNLLDVKPKSKESADSAKRAPEETTDES